MSGGHRYTVAVVGFGRMSSGYAHDAAMKRWFRYASHAEVLREHPRFAWLGVADPDARAQSRARETYGIVDVARDARDLRTAARVEVAVLATPPVDRLHLLDAFPNLRAVIVEKPLATTLAEAAAFVRACRERRILVQVNVPRRADRTIRALAAGGLTERIGAVQAANVVYGNGLYNHGPHMVDLVRLLAGEIASVRTDPDPRTHRHDGPIPGDCNMPFVARTDDAIPVAFTPVHFGFYREAEIDLWGERGRLAYRHGGLAVLQYARVPGKAPGGTFEIEELPSERCAPTLGDALYQIYDNLADALDGTEPLVSPGDEALRAAAVIDAVYRSAGAGGIEIACNAPASAGA
jgi:predicted dehydrogenase